MKLLLALSKLKISCSSIISAKFHNNENRVRMYVHRVRVERLHGWMWRRGRLPCLGILPLPLERWTDVRRHHLDVSWWIRLLSRSKRIGHGIPERLLGILHGRFPNTDRLMLLTTATAIRWSGKQCRIFLKPTCYINSKTKMHPKL